MITTQMIREPHFESNTEDASLRWKVVDWHPLARYAHHLPVSAHLHSLELSTQKLCERHGQAMNYQIIHNYHQWI